MSARTTTDLKPDANPELKSSAGKFYIEGIKYDSDYGRQAARGGMGQNFEDQKKISDEKTCRNLLSLVRKECVTRYPALFTDNSSSAIPLWIDVKHVFDSNDSRKLASGMDRTVSAGHPFRIIFNGILNSG